MENPESKPEAPSLGEIPPGYVNDDDLIAAEQAAPALSSGSITLMTLHVRFFGPNRWFK